MGACISCDLSRSNRSRSKGLKGEKGQQFDTFLGGIYGGFLEWWYSTTIGFPTKNDHFGVEIGGTTI